MSKDADVDMKDVELNEMDQEKQPMTGGEAGNGDGISPTGTEKNGAVKLKIPEEEDAKFTGLSKEELLKVAGTPGWVRTRWALLVLFWLGWVGMLAGAVAIIIQAPRCKPLPKMNWWNNGPLYQVGDVAAFTGQNNLKGLAAKMENLNELKVKGLVLGPIHETNPDDPQSLDFLKIASDVGTLEEFRNLIKIARKKSISVVLDLTPNYKGNQPWFSNGTVTDVTDKLKLALVFWMREGIDGVQLSGIDRVVSVTPNQWADIRAIMQNSTSKDKNRALFGVTEKTSAVEVSNLLNSSGVDLLMSRVLWSNMTGVDRAQDVQHLYTSYNQTSLAWSLSDRTQGHLASLVNPKLLKLNQMLLFTLPGTPVFNYGDEIGLEDEQDSKFPRMPWGPLDPVAEMNDTEKERLSNRKFFCTLSDLRGKERSLLHGDFRVLHNSTSCLAFLRQWDQSAGYLASFNWGEEPATLNIAHSSLPATATVTVSTDATAMPAGSSVQLETLQLGAGQAVLLQYPYIA
ncbi:hypothetical protein SKAU_G00322090 [Synaphobranchus kaupii]|uniref:Glycosyl hydrolase family 13 catalytic domain-containing protein n=1 Tax=Synaphobranchus kaupii TaxID=118154 RepID=A0A9Q1ENV1_SYNKA|nr:hypothetical protein SKAU_G00322090 [Synaphobranchus kaupii]